MARGHPGAQQLVSDPNNPSWHQNIAHRMDQEILPVFHEALTRIAGSPPAADDSDDDQDGDGEQP
ncbi:hypothetical protein AQF52_0199 [Streptomyces venezuelae]|uniref:hypothetical protein n=1 Tax=Streptomyces gardneri TaxID=66892 RepID=UPI0006BC2803|nr:hypothetical protein [Streptomyces gardneri]ALO05800.1 hypothetical protein AQF52_0199 [Streptomyces venezuelae]QPK43345.1 hypothetical protein H4W23_00950 [Streptomyces gardneri]WRK34569.1 hypothetical protein U0M97_00950 [Streptomyces venezuelae]CUM43998.1 hypothetical protein BN2537_16961 [Streptomyces venezuelae]